MNKEYEIYYEAFDIKDADERRRFILEQCGGDETLFDSIMRLFPADEEADGDTYGKYEIIEQLGKGGMGVVYLAQYTETFGTETFTKQVALKTINPSLKLEPKSIKIFLKEIKTLAELDHPHIARFLDIGTSEKGKPFFVMEYVDGVSLIEHCNKNKFSINERLEFFRQVLDAISYSHQKGFIHCDIKPNNVIVDSKGVPKVIDFGIASKYGSFIADKKQTTFFQNAFTPNYASPEQIRGEKNLSEKTDIYSLGVVLYELLTGQLPIELDESESYPNLISSLEKKVPPTLKKSVTKVMSDEERERLALERDCHSIAELKNSLSSNLDEIVQRAINQKPHRRYQSVKAFDEEIADYLSEESFTKQIKSAFNVLYRKTARQFRRFSWKWAVGAVFIFAVLLGLLSQSATFRTIPYYLQVRFSGNKNQVPLSGSYKKNVENSLQTSKKKVLAGFNDYTVNFESKKELFNTNVWTFSNYMVALSSVDYPLESERLDNILNRSDTDEGCWKEERTECKLIISGWVMLAKKSLSKPVLDEQLEFILKNQSPDGWFPAYAHPDDSRNAATYPTAIILWGLTEHLRANLIPAKDKERVQKAVVRGVEWLLKSSRKQTQNFQWSDCPNNPESYQIPSGGLDGTVIHVLHTVAEANLPIPYLADELKQIDNIWLNNLAQMATSPLEHKSESRCNTFTNDGDILDRTTRFSIPWSIIATLKTYPNGTDWQKAKAVKWLNNVPVENEYKGFNFGEAEHLIGLSHLNKNTP